MSRPAGRDRRPRAGPLWAGLPPAVVARQFPHDYQRPRPLVPSPRDGEPFAGSGSVRLSPGPVPPAGLAEAGDRKPDPTHYAFATDMAGSPFRRENTPPSLYQLRSGWTVTTQSPGIVHGGLTKRNRYYLETKNASRSPQQGSVVVLNRLRGPAVTAYELQSFLHRFGYLPDQERRSTDGNPMSLMSAHAPVLSECPLAPPLGTPLPAHEGRVRPVPHSGHADSAASPFQTVISAQSARPAASGCAGREEPAVNGLTADGDFASALVLTP
jgi:hypothetical protein